MKSLSHNFDQSRIFVEVYFYKRQQNTLKSGTDVDKIIPDFKKLIEKPVSEKTKVAAKQAEKIFSVKERNTVLLKHFIMNKSVSLFNRNALLTKLSCEQINP